MDTFIFKQPNITEKTSTIESFTILGKEDFIDKENNARVNDNEDNRVLAQKTIREDGSIKYSIRTDLNRKIYNPILVDIHSINKANSKFKTVNTKAFEYYLSFLRTKNQSWLFNAERESE